MVYFIIHGGLGLNEDTYPLFKAGLYHLKAFHELGLERQMI